MTITARPTTTGKHAVSEIQGTSLAKASRKGSGLTSKDCLAKTDDAKPYMLRSKPNDNAIWQVKLKQISQLTDSGVYILHPPNASNKCRQTHKS